jgi:4'-phosphopantetheinyl transferase
MDGALPRFRPPPPELCLASGEVHLWRLPAGADWAALLGARYGLTRLARAAHGKPYDPSDRVALAVSDSGPWLALAVSSLGPLGLDLECHRPLRRRERLLARFFAPEEREALAGAPDRWVLRFWTLKEAVVKAHGRGLAYGLQNVVGRLEGDWPVLQRIGGEAGPASRWQSFAFELAPGCDATLLVPAPAPTLLCFESSA